MAKKSLIKKLDKVFSEYIRLRDTKEGYFTCCSCGQIKPYEQADAGHYINRKWMSVRWNEKNVHAQCRYCNRFGEGNGPGYADFMYKTYGKKTVDYLLGIQREVVKWTDFELELLIKEYKKLKK